MIFKRAESKIKMRDFFMSKIALASDGTVISLPEKVQDSARPEEAGRFLYKIIPLLQCLNFAFKWLKVQLLSLIHSWVVALFSNLQSAYNVSLVKSTTYNKNRQLKGCHTISLLLGLFIALFCGKANSHNLTHLKLNSYVKKATIIIIMAFFMPFYSYAYTNDQIANAIFKAENSKSHPYGILTHYKHTTPRQTCINTIKHAKRDWNGRGDFISFLGKRYAPLNVANDSKGLNKNWIRNVKHFLTKADL